MRIIDWIVCVPIAVALFFCIRKMVRNVKEGRSIDGCDGDCAHCTLHQTAPSADAQSNPK